jgi:hypothetical protein
LVLERARVAGAAARRKNALADDGQKASEVETMEARIVMTEGNCIFSNIRRREVDLEWFIRKKFFIEEGLGSSKITNLLNGLGDDCSQRFARSFFEVVRTTAIHV